MKHISFNWKQFSASFLCLIFFCACSVIAQEKDKGLKISLQTDLLAYTTEGGWSAWVAFQHHQNKLSFAYVNFPNRYSDDYDETGVKDNDRFFRIQFARYFNPDKKMKNFFYGVNFQYHFRELMEDNTPNTLDANGFKIAPIIGFEWHPWAKKENAFNNLSLVLWVGPTFLFGDGFEDEFIFPDTGTIYPARDRVEGSAGVLISYTIFKNY